MTIQVDNALPPNVVEIGNEITQGVVDGLMSASPSASSANPYATEDLLDGKLSLTGGTLTGGIKIDSGAGVQITNANYIDYPDHFSYLNINYYGLSCEGDQDPFYLEGYYGLTFTNGCGYSRNGITFSDSTVQTTAAVSPDLTGYLTKADNLASVVSSSSARTNLGLGTMSTATATDYLAKADNLSGLASTSTARTNLGLGAVSTDAYATTAQAQAGTSTTTVISPATLLDAKYFAGGKSLNVNSYTTVTSGTGAIAGTIAMNAQQVASPTTAVGTASRYGSVANSSRGYGYTGALDFTKRVVIGGRFQKQNATTDSNTIFRFYFGKSNTVNDMNQYDKAIGFRVAGSGALQLTVATGSVLTVTTSSFTPVLNQCYDVVIVSDSGTATMFVNGTQVATSSGSPNTLATQSFFGIEAQNIAIISTPTTYYMVTDLFAQVNV